jgi:hypothetical protein
MVKKFGPQKAEQFEQMVVEFGIPPIEELANRFNQSVR